MLLFDLFLLICLSCFPCLLSLDVNGISAVRFAHGTGIFPLGRDGVLEVKFFDRWTPVCNYGFDYIAASTACFMMGYPPYGVPILNNRQVSTLEPWLTNFNCTGRIKLGPNSPDVSSTHLGYCQFEERPNFFDCPETRHVAIACLESMDLSRIYSPPQANFAPVFCPKGKSNEVRLSRGSSFSGRLEVKHPVTGDWGTVCADGFGVNEAKAVCRMLCSSGDDLAYAHAFVNVAENVENETFPIHLARVSCPVGAQSLNDCRLGDGWGEVRGCHHGMDIGVVCGPEEDAKSASRMPIESNLTCDAEIARVRFRRDQLGAVVDYTTIHLNRSLPAGCSLNFTFPSNDSVEVAFPMEKCGATYERSNYTTLAVQIALFINITRETDFDVFLLPVTCLVHRYESVRSSMSAIATSRLLPLVESRKPPAVEIGFFADRLFQRRVSDRINILPQRRVFTKISLRNPAPNAKMLLQNCWLSSNATREPVIVNFTPVNRQIHLLPISRSAIGFSFETTYFKRAAEPVEGGRVLKLFVECETRLCQVNETSRECIQFSFA